MSESYGVVAAIVVLGLLGLIGAFALNKALTVTYPTEGKLTTYESGVDPVGEGWAQVHIRYYLFAYLYVIFAVDAVYLFPWATVFAQLGVATLIEMFVFLAFVAVGLLYAYRKGVLRWT
ncbi:NADH-quinone oxidoreductase subunit A [Kribbella sp. NPDC056345]|uniref:NADH-quinone oxidoreductase subunit n=1 Tax=Kribbella albertanoniae TaxID=1266829 RepID=A0A4R4PJF7_9ACTN|nr:NADH-quinone oxidoreductase subunit A [Kribbella albertanoniae]TDC22201.1 NADH-quinone oxidoreductase subunit A [Kribbella albertanoniae]